MKKIGKLLRIAFIAIIALFMFNACDCIKGEGSIVSEDRNVKDFDGIELDISANVYLEKSNTFKLRIEAQENILDEIETYVSAGMLHIDYDDLCVISRRSVKIYISMPELTEIEVGGSGSVISSDTFDCKNLKLRISGSGDIEIGAIAQTIKCSINGSGDIELTGSADELEVSIRGSGDVEAIHTEAENVYVSVRGSGRSRVHATDYLEVDISGSGDVYYKGRPDIDSDINGSGNLRRIN